LLFAAKTVKGSVNEWDFEKDSCVQPTNLPCFLPTSNAGLRVRDVMHHAAHHQILPVLLSLTIESKANKQTRNQQW
jgi:hypothetical protein